MVETQSGEVRSQGVHNVTVETLRELVAVDLCWVNGALHRDGWRA